MLAGYLAALFERCHETDARYPKDLYRESIDFRNFINGLAALSRVTRACLLAMVHGSCLAINCATKSKCCTGLCPINVSKNPKITPTLVKWRFKQIKRRSMCSKKINNVICGCTVQRQILMILLDIIGWLLA